MIYNDVNTLEILQLNKTYNNKSLFKKDKNVALIDINLVFTQGLYAILGPNGAGKSTLINIITGGINQDSGKVLYNNKTTRKLGIEFRKILGFMPQQQTLYNSFTGREFLAYMATLKQIKKDNLEKEVLKCARYVNLETELDKRLSAYSGGMKQRLLAANALLNSPEIIVLDEPTAGLDPKERVRLRNLMKEKSNSSIVLFATHVVSDIETVADSVILIKDGQILDNLPPKDLIEKYAKGYNLEKVYLNIFGED